jgi:3-oxoacyl-[acyl-carrier-protein] synthase-1
MDPAVPGAARMLTLARSALDEVIGKLGDVGRLGQVPVAIGLPEPRAGFTQQDARWLTTELARTSKLGNSGRFSFGMEGHAAVIRALHAAATQVGQGSADVFVVGGVESYLHPDTLLELDAEGRLAAEDVRSGFYPGEGACFIAFASDRARSALRFPSLAQVTGIHSAAERPAAPGEDTVALGRALTEAVEGAAARRGSGSPPIDEIYCDINGERHRTDEWGFAALRTAQLFRDPTAYTTAPAECGDMGAASGALLLVLAVWAGLRGYARGQSAMIWTGSARGLRAAATIVRGRG